MLWPLVLAPFYVLLLAWSARELHIIFRDGHKRTSFQSGFHGLVVAQCFTRVMYCCVSAAANERNVAIVTRTMRAVAPAFQFACYTLFQLFFLQVAYRSRWPEHKRKWRTSYLVSNCIVFLASFVWGPISAILTDRHVISTAVWARTWQYSFVGVMFAALTVGFVACVLVVLPHRHTLRSHANLVPIGCLLAALCLSRALYDFLFAANVGSLQRWEANVPAIYYALYFCWEVLPTAMLQALLARWKAQAMRVGRRPVRVTKPRQSELLGLGWSDSSLDTALRDSDATSELSDDGQPDVIAL